jgi:coenzyme F420-reducing hydrogenase delta subunit
VTRFEPQIVGFLCRWCAYEGADAAGRARLSIPEGLGVIRVPCSGRVAPGLVLEAFSRGADGVLILGCRPGECHYRDGNSRAAARVALLRSVLEPLGVEPGRLVLDWVAAGEAERFRSVVSDAFERIRRLGPLGLGRRGGWSQSAAQGVPERVVSFRTGEGGRLGEVEP